MRGSAILLVHVKSSNTLSLTIAKTERGTKAFNLFCKVQEDISGSFESDNKSKAMETLLKSVNKLSSCEDLKNLVEIRDVEDALGIRKKLFIQQGAVIEQLLDAYGNVDRLNSDKRDHVRAKYWLEDSKAKVEDYVKRIDGMIKECKVAADRVYRPHNLTNVTKFAPSTNRSSI